MTLLKKKKDNDRKEYFQKYYEMLLEIVRQ
jgi:hypothetical protein